MLDTAQGGLLNSIQHLLSDIFIPALQTMTYGWGESSGPQKGANVKQDFIASLEGFVSVLSGAQQSLMEKVSVHILDVQGRTLLSAWYRRGLAGSLNNICIKCCSSNITLFGVKGCMMVVKGSGSFAYLWNFNLHGINSRNLNTRSTDTVSHS